MAFSTDKMHDEKIERDTRLEEDMLEQVGDAPRLTRQVLWKTDVRCVIRVPVLRIPLIGVGYCLYSRCCSSARSSIGRMWGMRRFWVCRQIRI